MLTLELLAYIFDSQPHILAQPMADWFESSRRFTAFVDNFRDKIRKKLRVTQEAESILDLRLELETAYRLLQERALSVAYEPQQSGKIRSPDFAVTFTTSLTFMVEVTRLRADQKKAIDERLVDAICSKLGQLQSQRCNVLLIGVEALKHTSEDIHTTMLHIKQRAEGEDSSFLRRHEFRDRAEFFNRYQRLSEIIIRGPHLQTTEPVAIWENSQAKYPLPGKVQTVLHRSHTV